MIGSNWEEINEEEVEENFTLVGFGQEHWVFVVVSGVGDWNFVGVQAPVSSVVEGYESFKGFRIFLVCSWGVNVSCAVLVM